MVVLLMVHFISSTQLPNAVGAAYSLKMDKKDACAVTYFGDGGTSEVSNKTWVRISSQIGFSERYDYIIEPLSWHLKWIKNLAYLLALFLSLSDFMHHYDY